MRRYSDRERDAAARPQGPARIERHRLLAGTGALASMTLLSATGSIRTARAAAPLLANERNELFDRISATA
jgi:hypothetical protein